MAAHAPALVPTVCNEKPSGTATVPDFSSIETTVTAGAKNQKRKRGDGGRIATAEKRTRSSAAGSTAAKRKAAVTDSGPSKRQRTGAGSSGGGRSDASAFALDIPSTCPPWVRNALDLLASQDLGAQWQALVAAWLRFETAAGLTVPGGRLPSKGRPPLIAGWIKNARTPGYPVNLGDVNAFKRTFNAWWNSLQPKWRTEGRDGALKRDGGDWRSMCEYSGVNGLLSVVACLFFWGSATLTPSQSCSWDTAVDDVLYVLEQLAAASQA